MINLISDIELRIQYKGKIRKIKPGEVFSIDEVYLRAFKKPIAEGKVKILENYLDSILLEACNELNKIWEKGAYEKIEIYFPELYREIEKAEERINQLWHMVKNREASLYEYKSQVNIWKELNLKAIEKLKKLRDSKIEYQRTND